MGLLLLTKTKKVIKLETIDKNFKAGAQKFRLTITKSDFCASPKENLHSLEIVEALLAAKDYALTWAGGRVDGSKGSCFRKVGLETVQTPVDIWSFYKARLLKGSSKAS